MKGKLNILAAVLLVGTTIIQSAPINISAETLVYEEKNLSGFSYYLNNYYQTTGLTKIDAGSTSVSLLSDSVDVPENVAIANVSERLNIRSGPGTEYDIVGYLPKNAYCYILEDADSGWVEVKSGEVSGYVKIDYLFAGEEGQSVAEELGELTAVVNAYSINLRSTPSTESEENIICVLSEGAKLSVLEEVVLNKADDGSALWVKVLYDGKEGYLAKKYVDINYQWAEAVKVVTPTPTPLPTPVPTQIPEDKSKEDKNSVEDKGSEVETEDNKQEDEDKKKDEKSDKSSKSDLRKQIISTAEEHLGLRYKWGGTDLKTGADCSGYCLAVYRACGIDTSGFNRASYDIAVSSKGRSIKRSELKKGDLVFYGRGGKINHVAMYYGDNKIIHESSSSGKSIISNLDYSTPIKYMNFLGD